MMNTQLELGEVLEAFMTEVDPPNREILERYVGDYPQYAQELAAFASEWLLLEVMPDAHDFQPGGEEQAQAMSAMERLRQRKRELEMVGEDAGKVGANPFLGKEPKALKAIAARLGLDTSLMAKLKNRLILAETVPQRLVEALARELDVMVEVVGRWLQAPPRLQGARFKADGKPIPSRQESFTEAVSRSTLDDGQKRKWIDQD